MPTWAMAGWAALAVSVACRRAQLPAGLAPCLTHLSSPSLSSPAAYTVPEQFNWDFGEPTELCKETSSGSGVFTRDWTKATVQLDCNTWTPTITLK